MAVGSPGATEDRGGEGRVLSKVLSIDWSSVVETTLGARTAAVARVREKCSSTNLGGGGMGQQVAMTKGWSVLMN